ncbi:MAG: N-acylneuraminate-9-phosphate synthase [Myxococcales bacterium]|nr:N-acylneuraminate-9-phosphate synthase [Myxococcales bacterium]
MSFLESFPDKPVIIAELGAKYAAMDILERTVHAAKEAGADLVKFQTFRAATLAQPDATFRLADGREVSQYEFFANYELSLADHERLDACCREARIGWLSTPSHPDDVALLERFEPIAYKTGSDDLTNIPFLRQLAERGRPMIVSTGMASIAEVERAVDAIVAAKNQQLILLHAVTSYPAMSETANLRAIETLRCAFGFPVGLSDHTPDELTSVLATALGAVVIEKHFVLDHALKLPDDEAALDPQEFAHLVKRVRLTPKALGTGVKVPVASELEWRTRARKSLHASCDIARGQSIGPGDVAVRRPATGIAPEHFEVVVGRQARRDIAAGEPLTWNMF